MSKSKGGIGKIIAILLVLVLLIAIVAIFFINFDNSLNQNSSDEPTEDITEQETNFEDTHNYSQKFLPSVKYGEVIFYPNFALSYSEDHEVSEWAAYEMTMQRLTGKVVRSKIFKQDHKPSGLSANYFDYRGSGYDRGHLVPAADLAYDSLSVPTTFLMSNITPQEPGFNRGIWRELEEQVRDWTRQNRHLYIVSGPVLDGDPKEIIGRSTKITVPRYFYKVLLDNRKPNLKAIGFVLPNEKSDKDLHHYARPVDYVEAITGLDFFAALPDEIEADLESSKDVSKWPINDFWFRLRTQEWNSWKY